MANGTDIEAGDYVIHLTRADEGLWHILEITERALVMENPKGERRLINVAFAHHLVKQDSDRFEVQAAFSRAEILRLAGEDPAALVTRLARQYGSVTVREIRERLEPLFATKESFRKWWASRATKAALIVAPHLEFIAPSTYRYLEAPRAVEADEPAETPRTAPPVESTPWPELVDVIENGDGSGAVANRIKWRHAAGLQRAIQAGRAAEWESEAVQNFLTTVLLDERLPDTERLRAATELSQLGWIQEDEVRSLGLEFWAPPAGTPLPIAPEPPPRPERVAPEAVHRVRETAARSPKESARRPASAERAPAAETPTDPATALTEIVLASTQLPPSLWGANMDRMAARLISLLTSDPAQLTAGGRLDVFSRSLAEVSAQCETLSMTPLSLRLLCHPAMPGSWKSSLLDGLYERSPETADQIHRALRADPGASGLYLRSLERRCQQGTFRALIEEAIARDLAAPQRSGLWNYAMHELEERDDSSTESRVLALLLADAAPSDAAREQVEAFIKGDAPVGLQSPAASPSDGREPNGHLVDTEAIVASEVASVSGQSLTSTD
jgi:hypothetical protein